MKTTNQYIALAVLALTFAACTQDEDFIQQGDGKKHIAYARIDTELQELLKDSSARVKLRDVLIVNYIDSLDIINKENNMDLASKDINLIEKLNNLLKSCQEYGETYKSLIGQGVSNIANNFTSRFKTDIPTVLEQFFSKGTYKIKGSIGQGRVTQ